MTFNPIMMHDGQFHEWPCECDPPFAALVAYLPPVAADLAPPPVPTVAPMFLSLHEQGRRP